MKDILSLAQENFSKVQAIRHYLHENPETGLQEYKTSAYIMAQLDELNIPYQKVMDTGVVALIEGGKPGKTVLLRADIDALEVLEEADVPYKSKIKGMMHACGHDGHAAGLLGAAMILNTIKDDLCGNVKLMFQPAEEKSGGALPMIEAGVLENPRVDAAFGLHLWGPLAKGKVCVKHGAMMAAPDTFKLKIKGKGTHAAMPHLGIDPILIASQIVTEIQGIVARKINPLIPAVISVCQIHGGDTFNVIPETVTLGGTIRTFTDIERKSIPVYLEKIIKGICDANDATYEFESKEGYPPLINDDKMTDLVFKSCEKIALKGNVSELEEASMGGEDFAYLAKHVPSSFFFVGIANEGQQPPVHHHPQFAWDDDNLIKSSAYLAQIAFDFLNGGE